MSTLLETSEADWQGTVLDAPTAVLVDFWAAWCAPCRMLEPILTQLAERLAGSLAVAKIDVQANASLAARYGVQNLPAMLLFKDGEAIQRFSGPIPLRVLEEKVKALL